VERHYRIRHVTLLTADWPKFGLQPLTWNISCLGPR